MITKRTSRLRINNKSLFLSNNHFQQVVNMTTSLLNKILIYLNKKASRLKVHQNPISHLLLQKMTYLINSDKIIMLSCLQLEK